MSFAENWAINGRFLTQPTTGVQRYAANVVKAMDQALDKGTRLPVVAPAAASDLSLSKIQLERCGPLKGHGWEQVTLPLRWREPLLNLCNTAPAAKKDQIICIHDANVFAAPESYSPAFRACYTKLQPLLVRRSLRVATVSHTSARQLARYLPISLDNIAVLPNGHEHVFEWNPARAELAPDIVSEIRAAGRQYVLALGSRARHKNLELLIKAAEALDNLQIDIVIAGGGAGIFSADLLGQRSNVRMMGRVSDDDLAHLLQNALCLAFPSLTEGFGLPILEAMASGCPVVASNCASMPEVCGRAALLASPHEVDQWIAHVRALRQSGTLVGELRELGYERVRDFSWSRTAAGYLELLQQPDRRSSRSASRPSISLQTAVVIATRGRADLVEATVRHLLDTQTHPPRTVIVSCVDKSDAGGLALDPRVKVVTGKPGLASQRNRGLDSLPSGTEVVVFFDDDFVPHRNWLRAAAEAFIDEVRLVGFTGHVFADGIKGPGIRFDEAVSLAEGAPTTASRWIAPYSPYGCNMAFRVSAIGEARFDERLVLYGWLEDRDFAAELAKGGGLFVKSAEAVGVHMGTKIGRVSGERLGYSQIVNPLYMLRKGTMTLRQVTGQICRNTASNVGRLFWPEPFIDRRGRLRGNLVGIADVARGRLEPERAALLTSQQDFPKAAKGKAI